MNTPTHNRFIEEVEAVTSNNPDIDVELAREWQEITKFIENIPVSPKPAAAKPARLQPIPLKMFSR